MTETLFRAYLPLLIWPGLGLLLFRLLPLSFPRLLGRALYWVGIPFEIFSLARRANLSGNVGLTPVIAVGALVLGLGLAQLSWQSLQWMETRQTEPLLDASGSAQIATAAPDADRRSRQGSFILSSMLGNTGFVGLAIAPSLISDGYLSWVVFYSITHNLLGTYGLGVLCASSFGKARADRQGWVQLRDVLTVPSLWAFILGISTRAVPIPTVLDEGLHASIWITIPCALLLMGMRLSQVQSWQSFQLALVPTLIKILVVPACIGLIATGLQFPADPRLALVLMSGMPSAFAGLILAEEYDLDRELIASSIAISTVALLLAIPLWLFIFPT